MNRVILVGLACVLSMFGCKRNDLRPSLSSSLNNSLQAEVDNRASLLELTRSYRKAGPAECASVPKAQYLGSNIWLIDTQKAGEVKSVLFNFAEDVVSQFGSTECENVKGKFEFDQCLVDLGTVGDLMRERLKASPSQGMGLLPEHVVSNTQLQRLRRAGQCGAIYFVSLAAEWWHSCSKKGRVFDPSCGKICMPTGDGGVALCQCSSGDADYFAMIDSAEIWQRVSNKKERIVEANSHTAIDLFGMTSTRLSTQEQTSLERNWQQKTATQFGSNSQSSFFKSELSKAQQTKRVVDTCVLTDTCRVSSS